MRLEASLSAVSLAQLGDKLQQGLVARPGRDRDRPPPGAGGVRRRVADRRDAHPGPVGADQRRQQRTGARRMEQGDRAAPQRRAGRSGSRSTASAA
jgi:hypothetical protein